MSFTTNDKYNEKTMVLTLNTAGPTVVENLKTHSNEIYEALRDGKMDRINELLQKEKGLRFFFHIKVILNRETIVKEIKGRDEFVAESERILKTQTIATKSENTKLGENLIQNVVLGAKQLVRENKYIQK